MYLPFRNPGILFVIAVLLAACRGQSERAFSSADFELKMLAPGVYAGIHKFGGKAICNVGVVDNGKETFIFDTFLSPGVAGELLSAVESLGLSPVKYAINSHWHNDHIRGNQMFGEGVRIISTPRTRELIAYWEPREIADELQYAPGRFAHYDSLYQAFSGNRESREFQQILMWRPYYETLSESHQKVRTRLPDLMVDSSKAFDGPKRRVRLLSRGPGHTESDLVLYLPDDGILFTGDLVFNRCHPYVAHGSLPGWIAWLDYMDSLQVSQVVPGHGKPGTGALMGSMKDYLTTLQLLAMEIHTGEKGESGIINTPIPEAYATWWFDRFFAVNLKFAYDEAGKARTE